MWRAASAAGPWVTVQAPAPAPARNLSATTATLGAFTVSNAQNPLPVELVSFTAVRRGPDAYLSWATAQELNNQYFEVESSADGRTFRALGRVAGQGTTTRRHTYAFTDANLARYNARVVYYRLRQVDTGGTENFSPVRSVELPRSTELVLFPNPATTSATLLGAGPNNVVHVLDALGREVCTAQASPAGQAQLQLPPGLPSGVYLVRTGGSTLRLTVGQ
jgi:hypothetical protein